MESSREDLYANSSKVNYDSYDIGEQDVDESLSSTAAIALHFCGKDQIPLDTYHLYADDITSKYDLTGCYNLLVSFLPALRFLGDDTYDEHGEECIYSYDFIVKSVESMSQYKGLRIKLFKRGELRRVEYYCNDTYLSVKEYDSAEVEFVEVGEYPTDEVV